MLTQSKGVLEKAILKGLAMAAAKILAIAIWFFAVIYNLFPVEITSGPDLIEIQRLNGVIGGILGAIGAFIGIWWVKK